MACRTGRTVTEKVLTLTSRFKLYASWITENGARIFYHQTMYEDEHVVQNFRLPDCSGQWLKRRTTDDRCTIIQQTSSTCAIALSRDHTNSQTAPVIRELGH